MTSISEYIRHYQRSIDRSVKDEARLLHCLDKLSVLPINMQCLQETMIGRTMNNLRKHDGVVGQKATTLIAKWRREIVVQNADSNDEYERLYADDTENVEPHFGTNYSNIQENGTNSTSKNDSPDQPVSSSTDSNMSTAGGSMRKENSKNCNGKTSESYQGNSSIPRSSAKKENDSSVRSDGDRKTSGKTNDKKRRRESDLIDIDCTMGASFAEALGMLDVLSTSKRRKLLNDKESSLSCEASTSSKHKRIAIRSSFDETPILLTKRPQRALDIDIEIPSSSCTVTKPETQRALVQPKKQTTQLTDEVTTNIISRTTKTKVYSGNSAVIKCKKVPTTLFEMCIKILQDNIDLLECIGGVPFDILRPVLERTTCEQLMTLEDYNPYLMEDTHCLWEQHCRRRFRTKSREELETWRDMYIRCLDEEQAKFNSLTAIIKVSNKRQTKPAYVDTHTIATKSRKANQMISSNRGTATLSSSDVNKSTVGESGSQMATKSKDSNQARKRLKKSNDDPDWTPTTWYKTLYKKVPVPKPVPKQQIKKTIDTLRYDRAKALEKEKEEWKRRRR